MVFKFSSSEDKASEVLNASGLYTANSQVEVYRVSPFTFKSLFNISFTKHLEDVGEQNV